MRRSQIVIAAVVLLSVTTAWTMLGYSSGLQTGSGRKATNVQAPSPASFDANSPSKEYVYAGARLVAAESGYSISPTYQSFAGNGDSAVINVTAPSGANWSASTTATSWITITSGSNGTGNGQVHYTVGANTAQGATIRQGTITVNSQTFTVYQGINFADVPSNYIFYEFIGILAARGVTVGCGGGNFCPNAAVAQQEMAAFVIRAAGQFNPPTPPPPPRFNDVPTTNPFYNFIEQMAVRGIWLGCLNGNYCPGDPVRRDEMAAMMIRGRGEFSPPTPPTQHFTDVPPSNAYYNFIDRMWVLQITSGCTSNPPNYCPADSIPRGQMAVFLVRAFNL
jgi:hypothetical protein